MNTPRMKLFRTEKRLSGNICFFLRIPFLKNQTKDQTSDVYAIIQ